MRLIKNKTYIHGFEGYGIVPLSASYFYAKQQLYFPYSFLNSNYTYLINQNLSFNIETACSPKYSWLESVVITPPLCNNHPDLMATANKVYFHPSCTISRSMVLDKYKKGLNPYLSDAVIIPAPDFDNLTLKDVALFVNDDAKIIGMLILNEDSDVRNMLKYIEIGTRLGILITCSYLEQSREYKMSDLLNAELVFVGQILMVPRNQSWIIDALTHALPIDKIVYEESVQEFLGCDNNQLDLDTMISIHDMLDSSDDDTVSAGLKSLSMMDWIHYPNSIKYIMQSVSKYKWVYNKAMNSTSVKFMFKSLCPDVKSRRGYPGMYNEDIYQQDYELFKKLRQYYDKLDENKVVESMRFLSFMTTENQLLIPKLKS